MWVKKVVEALGDSWQGHPTAVSPKYIENPFRLSKLLTSLRRQIIITTEGHPQGNLSSLFDGNYEGFNTIFVENFEIFSHSFSITISYPKILFPFIWRKPVSCRRVTLPAERKKKTLTPTGLRAWSNCPRLGYANPLPIRIGFAGRTEMSPSILQNYFLQDHWSVSCLQAR